MDTTTTRWSWLTRRLSRVTSSGTFIPEVDGLRFVAIAGVVLVHELSAFIRQMKPFGEVELPRDYAALVKQDLLVRFVRHGEFGVPLFFVISGFVLSLPFAKRYFESAPRPSLKAYYLRRLTRLEPTYAISLILCSLYLLVSGQAPSDFVARFLASLFYSNNLIYGDFSPINGVIWSLEVEIHFYLLAPLVATVFVIRRSDVRRALLLALVVLFGIFAQVVIWPTRDFALRHSLLNHFQYFLAGYLLADLYLERGDAATRYRNDALTLVGGAGVMVILWDYPGAKFLLPLFALQFCWGVFTGTVSRAVMRWTPLYLVGGMCYTIYLYHAHLIEIVSPALFGIWSPGRPFKLDFALYAGLMSAAILAVCVPLFVVAERPFMRNWLAEWRARRRGSAREVHTNTRTSFD